MQQNSGLCSLTQGITYKNHKLPLSAAMLWALTLPRLPASPGKSLWPTTEQGNLENMPCVSGTSPLKEVPTRSSFLPPSHATQGLGLCFVLLPKHSSLCQFGLQHKYCETADSLVPIMVILQVTTRKIFFIVCGHILLPVIYDLDEEKFSWQNCC